MFVKEWRQWELCERERKGVWREREWRSEGRRVGGTCNLLVFKLLTKIYSFDLLSTPCHLFIVTYKCVDTDIIDIDADNDKVDLMLMLTLMLMLMSSRVNFQLHVDVNIDVDDDIDVDLYINVNSRWTQNKQKELSRVVMKLWRSFLWVVYFLII